MITITPEQEAVRKHICLPLDDKLETEEDYIAIVRGLKPVVNMYKAGMKSFNRFGHKAITMIHDEGSEVFHDQKFHDIPNTVRGSAKEAAELGVYMFNVHTAGGYEMMQEAMVGANSLSTGRVPIVLGVTVLTTIDNLRYMQDSIPITKNFPIPDKINVPVHGVKNSGFRENMHTYNLNLNKLKDARDGLVNFPYKDAIDLDVLASKSKGDEKVRLEKQFQKEYGGKFEGYLRALNLQNVVPDTVLNRALIAVDAELGGIVCSAADLSYINDSLPTTGFRRVTPGIESPEGHVGYDQKRTFTPGNAIKAGATDLVIGRGITGGKTLLEQLERGQMMLQDIVVNGK